MKKTLFAISIIIAVVYACTHDTISPGTSTTIPVTGGGSTPIAANDTVCFQSQILPIFKNSCSSCHTGSSASKGVVLTDYASISKGVTPLNANASLYYTVIGTTMPPSGSTAVSATDKALIQKWINQGAMNTTCSTSGTGGTPTPTPTPAPASDTVCFQNEVLPLYQTYCASTGCHNTSSAKEGIILTTYAQVMNGIKAKDASGSRYYSIITKGSMPPRNSPQLSSAQTAIILKWINQGALNTVCASTTCDTTKTTYSNGISQIFATYCNGCHGTAPGSGNVVLSDYASAKAAGTGIKANFLNAINYAAATSSKNMPPSGKLNSCQITQITKWINSGCPQ